MVFVSTRANEIRRRIGWGRVFAYNDILVGTTKYNISIPIPPEKNHNKNKKHIIGTITEMDSICRSYFQEYIDEKDYNEWVLSVMWDKTKSIKDPKYIALVAAIVAQLQNKTKDLLLSIFNIMFNTHIKYDRARIIQHVTRAIYILQCDETISFFETTVRELLSLSRLDLYRTKMIGRLEIDM